MLKGYSQMINCYANSVIDDETVVFMSANINADKTYNVSQTIQNVDLYEANKDECDGDYAEFKELVDKIVEGSSEVKG